MHHRTAPVRSLAPLALLAMAACFDEDELQIYDLSGTLVVPREAAMQTIQLPVDAAGEVLTDPNATVDHFESRVLGPDVRLIGPVYVGLYADVVYDIVNYPYPEVGPTLPTADPSEKVASAYPFGGTSVGDFRYACLKAFQCKMISGRYVDFQSILDFYNDVLYTPVTDAEGHPVTSADVFRSICYEQLAVTADSEVRITATKDLNGDGELDENDLAFVENEDGDFVGHFEIQQADYFDGMKAWAWMDAPKGRSMLYTSCNDQLGYQEDTYDQRWYAGTAQVSVLNRPFDFLADDDWVASRGPEWTTPWTQPEIRLDFNIGSGDIGPLRDEAAAAAAEEGE